MNTKLRLLIDESVEDPVTDAISRIAAFNAVAVRDLENLRGKSDVDVMRHAKTEQRIVMTMDVGFNRTNYPICTHDGIIRIRTRSKHGSVVSDSIHKFSKCGHRSMAKHAITDITQEGYTIETLKEKTAYRFR